MPRWVRWLQPLLSGVFTVDNLDYVRRDAYLTGVAVGPVDVERLRRYAFISDRGLTLYEPGLPALEMFLTARRFMYQQVYFHRTVRAIDLDLAEVFGPSHPGDLRRRLAGRPPCRPTPTSTSTRFCTRPPAGRAASPCRRTPRPGDGTVTRAVADGVAGDPPAPPDVARRGRVPRRVRGAAAVPTRRIATLGAGSPAAWRSTSPRSTPGRPIRRDGRAARPRGP